MLEQKYLDTEQTVIDGNTLYVVEDLNLSGGAKLFRFPNDMMNAAFKAAMDIYSDLNNKNPAWKKVYADFSTFRRDSNLWFRFTEAGFDDFMQQQRL